MTHISIISSNLSAVISHHCTEPLMRAIINYQSYMDYVEATEDAKINVLISVVFQTDEGGLHSIDNQGSTSAYWQPGINLNLLATWDLPQLIGNLGSISTFWQSGIFINQLATWDLLQPIDNLGSTSTY